MALNKEFVNLFTWVYMSFGFLHAFTIIASFILFYFIENETSFDGNFVITTIYFVKISFAILMGIPGGCIFAQYRFFKPDNMCCIFVKNAYIKYANNVKQEWLVKINNCNNGLTIFMIIQIIFLYFMYSQQFFQLPFICEVITFGILLYMLLYRMIKKTEYFGQYIDFNNFTQSFELSEQIQNKNASSDNSYEEPETIGKTANISPCVLADPFTFSQSFSLIYKIWVFIISFVAVTIFVAIYLPIIICMVLIALIYGLFGRCCSRNLRRQIILCGGFKGWLSFFVRNKYKLIWTSMTCLPVIKKLLNDYYTASLLKKYTQQIDRVPK
eukprot:65480_1